MAERVIQLKSLYDVTENKLIIYRKLYYLLSERLPEENISHRKMPSFEEHISFIKSKPYKEWNLIINKDGDLVGTIYVTNNNEIGVGILNGHKQQGYAVTAIALLLRANPCKEFLANINPYNQKSIYLFESLGFKHVQNTYRRDPIVP